MSMLLFFQGYSYDYGTNFDATVSNAFSAACFRFGHTLIPETVRRFTPQWTSGGPDIRLKDR